MKGAERIPVELHIRTGAGVSGLGLTWSTGEDARSRAFPLHRLQVPWAPAKRQEVPATAAVDAPS